MNYSKNGLNFFINFDPTAKVYEVFLESGEYVGCEDTRAEAIKLANKTAETYEAA